MKVNPTLFIFIALLPGCNEVGPDINHRLSSDKKYLFAEDDVLSYESDTDTEQFEVIKIVKGQ